MGRLDIVFIAAMFLVMYFFMLRPKIKEQRETEAMLKALKKGDKVLTTAGMYGEVVGIKDDVVTLKVGDNARIDFNRAAITKLANAKPGAAGKAEKPEREKAETQA